MSAKVCTRCGVEKPISAFPQKTPGKLHSWCRICKAASVREYKMSVGSPVREGLDSPQLPCIEGDCEDPRSAGTPRCGAHLRERILAHTGRRLEREDLFEHVMVGLTAGQ